MPLTFISWPRSRQGPWEYHNMEMNTKELNLFTLPVSAVPKCVLSPGYPWRSRKLCRFGIDAIKAILCVNSWSSLEGDIAFYAFSFISGPCEILIGRILDACFVYFICFDFLFRFFYYYNYYYCYSLVCVRHSSFFLFFFCFVVEVLLHFLLHPPSFSWVSLTPIYGTAAYLSCPAIFSLSAPFLSPSFASSNDFWHSKYVQTNEKVFLANSAPRDIMLASYFMALFSRIRTRKNTIKGFEHRSV